ncbi:MAG: hypothetical protein A2W23_03145 [Planctomycetes bacterium RBG_16_43_13]|nr:MAG: hypothetical protein A2W23_03145 [Planctomycetes bacterium RBG_16_43_13]
MTPLEDIAGFLSKSGKRGAQTLDILGKYHPFVTAVSSTIGWELLKDDIQRHGELLEKIYNEQSSPQELAEFRYLKLRIKKVSERITIYLDKMKEIR